MFDPPRSAEPTTYRCSNWQRALKLYPPFSRVAAAMRHRAVCRHAARLPPLDADRTAILTALRQDGILESRAAFLAFEGAGAMLSGCAALVQRWRSTGADVHHPAGPSRPPRDLIEDFPDVYRWGLDNGLLDLVENYIGLPPLYLGYDLKCEHPDQRAHGVRMWHRDVEDRRLLKLLIYLAPVAAENGPFSWLPEPASEVVRRRLHYVRGYVADPAMARHLPAGTSRIATGERGHAIFFDGARLFHRAGVPTGGCRWSITFNYSSRRPLRVFSPGPGPALRDALLPHLTARQRGCLIV